MGTLANGFYNANEPSKILGHGFKQISDINHSCPLVTVQIAERLPSISQLSMAATNSNYNSLNIPVSLLNMLTFCCREVSHPIMIELNAFTAKGIQSVRT